MRAAARRPIPDDLPTQPITQPSPHWPPPYGEAPGQRAAQQPSFGPPAQGYHFPQGAQEADGGPAFAAQTTQPTSALPFNRFPPAPEAAAGLGYPQGTEPYGYPNGSGQQQWAQQGEARNFDLGSYMSASGQGYGSDVGQFEPPPFAAAPHGYGEGEAEYDETMLEDEEEPRRGRRSLLIVAALVGAIGLGGGMAYAYKMFFPARSGPAPLIKDTQGPIKSKPEVADGRGFPHTDKKLLNRLSDDTGPQGAGAPPNPADAQDDRLGDDPNAPRKVRLIPIAPNGGQPPVQVVTTTAPPAPANPPAMALPPGVTIDNIPPRGQPPPSAARAQLPPPPAAVPPRAAPQPPVRIASAASMPPPAEAEPTPPVRKAPAPAKPAVSKNPVPKSKEASAAPAATGAGYVAVLSSQKSRMDALKIFANMQEKYGEVLSSRTPDVQEANLGEKGVWYRLVVGPPGSREAAASLCTQLKAAGYNGCWVTAY
jgi:hypothetical protein